MINVTTYISTTFQTTIFGVKSTVRIEMNDPKIVVGYMATISSKMFPFSSSDLWNLNHSLIHSFFFSPSLSVHLFSYCKIYWVRFLIFLWLFYISRPNCWGEGEEKNVAVCLSCIYIYLVQEKKQGDSTFIIIARLQLAEPFNYDWLTWSNKYYNVYWEFSFNHIRTPYVLEIAMSH